jgi:phage gp29-like protein
MSKIIDVHGNPLQSETLREPQTARLSQLRSEYAAHPSRGLTPMRLARIMEDAELGNLQAQAELFADMEEKDAHIYSEMHKRKSAILTIDWKIDPPRNADAAEKANAEWLSEVAADIIDADFLLALMDGVGFGYSNVEIEWQLAERQWMPGALSQRPATWFQLARDDQNALRLRDHSADGAVLQPFGWVRHVHRAKSGYIARCGLHRVLAWPYLFKNYAIRDLAELLEIYGIPIRLGKYPSGIGEKEKATLLRAVTELGHAAAGIIPEGMSIEFQTAATGSHDPHLAMNDWAERSVSKAVLGGTLTSQADGKSSTNALGNVHNEVRHDLLASDARQIAATITRDLLYPLLALNRGNVDPRRMPQLVFDVSEQEDFTAFSAALPNLVDIGTPIPVSWVQKKLGIPAPAKDEAVLVRVSRAQGPNGPASLMAQLMAGINAVPPPADQLAAQLGAEAADAWQAVLAHITAIVDSADSLPALQASLLASYGGLPLEDLQAVMAQGLIAAQAAGMADVEAGK